MSYCRFSSDNWTCDVYVYEDFSGGWTTHVADNKVSGWVPRWWHPPRAWTLQRDRSKWTLLRFKVACRLSWVTYRLQMLYLDIAPRRDLGLLHDGESFCDEGPAECADRLEDLRGLGYRVPQYAIDNLRTEALELDQAARDNHAK